MKVAIVGAGFTGLACAVELTTLGHEVIIFEEGEKVGGLAGGFSQESWEWSLEKYYHHIFKGDEAIIGMAKKVSWPAFFRIPQTNCFIEGKEIPLDSPTSLMKFNKLDWKSRIHMGLGLALLKIIPEGKFLEKHKVINLLPVLVGKEGYEKVWKRLLAAKFGKYVDEVNMAWFWARVAKRTQSLGYFEGGFLKLAEKMAEYIEKQGGKVRLGTPVNKFEILNFKFSINGDIFDKVVLTIPAPLVDKLIGKGVVKWPKIDYLWGQTLVLETEEKLIGSYWLNILEKEWPFVVVVEHTNFINKKHYNGKNIIYVGNYLEENNQQLVMGEKDLLRLYWPFLKKINKNISKRGIRKMWKYKAPFAQPVFPINYSKLLPDIITPIPGLYVANMSMVYPYDRGTNYAVEMGQRVAREISNNQ